MQLLFDESYQGASKGMKKTYIIARNYKFLLPL